MSITPVPPQPHLQNARTRFALSGDQIYSYEQAKYLPIAGTFQGKDGVTYDLVKLARCIRENQFIESAIVHKGFGQMNFDNSVSAFPPTKIGGSAFMGGTIMPLLVKAPVVK